VVPHVVAAYLGHGLIVWPHHPDFRGFAAPQQTTPWANNGHRSLFRAHLQGCRLFESCQRDMPKFPGMNGQQGCRRRAIILDIN
jgi:hypothetical protein